MATGMARRPIGKWRGWLVALVALAVVALPLAWYLISPLFIDRRVDEGFPAVAVAPGTAVPAAAGRAEEPTAKAMTTPTAVASATPAPTIAAASAAAAAGTASPTFVPATPTPPLAATVVPTIAPTPAGPTIIGSGQFTTVDTIHKGVGTATIYQLPDGRRILRFEGFTVTNGPDLFVYFSGHAAPRSSGELHAIADFEVARLKGNVGDQNYELPAELDLPQFQSVVIYCKRFATVFSTATLGAGR